MVPCAVSSILTSHPKSALYPSGLRGESAKLLFASSNLAEASMSEELENRLTIVGIFSLVIIYGLFIFGKLDPVPGYFTPNQIVIADTTITPVAKQGLDTIVDVKGKNAFFIGDSHTSNHEWGWQKIVCDETGMKMINYSEIGKHLPWMVKTTNMYLTDNFDYCFIYGGANDIHANRNPYDVVTDIQKIVDLCNSKNIYPVVLTGFDAEKCVRPIKGQEFYPKAYSRYQKLLIDSIKNTIVIDTRVVVRTDCGDWTCHMTPSGHKKVAERVIKNMKFKTY